MRRARRVGDLALHSRLCGSEVRFSLPLKKSVENEAEPADLLAETQGD
jgi:hypothetical protein